MGGLDLNAAASCASGRLDHSLIGRILLCRCHSALSECFVIFNVFIRMLPVLREILLSQLDGVSVAGVLPTAEQDVESGSAEAAFPGQEILKIMEMSIVVNPD